MFPMPRPAPLLAAAIHRLMAEHLEHPLRHLREQGLQARLGHLLLAALPDAERFAAAEVAFGHHAYRSRDRVLRVQHGLRLAEAGAAAPAAGTLLLRAATEADPLRLERGSEGHLDLADALRGQDVAAVIEVVSASSAATTGRERCRSAVAALHALARSCSRAGLPAPECHFVFIDRAMPVREHASCATRPRTLPWEAMPEAAPGTTRDGRGWQWAGAGRLGTSHVHVYDFDEAAEPRHRIAVA